MKSWIVHLESFMVEAEDEDQARRKARYVIFNQLSAPTPVSPILIEAIEESSEL